MEKPKDLRFFKIGDRVFYDEPFLRNDEDLRGYATILLINNKDEDATIDDDTIVLLKGENGVTEFEGYGDRVYKIAEDISEKVGETVCWEHNIEDYPFFIPANDENYYAFELGLYNE